MIRTVTKLHKEWLFRLGEVQNGQKNDLDDEMWRVVDLPHDWSIEGTFVQFRDEFFGMFQNLDSRVGYLPQGIGWYRKHFTVPEDWKGKRVTIQFDGVYRDSDVYINEQHLGHRPYGYSTFVYDLTPHLKFGATNLLAVRVDNEGISTRWYTGSGIYRKVQLIVTDPRHVAQWGTYITTPNVTKEIAKVTIHTRVVNETSSEAVEIELMSEVLDGEKVVGSDTVPESLNEGEHEYVQAIEVKKPRLWSPNSPALYQLRTTVKVSGEVKDEYYTTFGIRTFRFDPDEGFFLNGEHMKFKGVCLHHDNGCLGAKVYARAAERKIEILKGMGCNAIRTSHNPPDQELLEYCDKMGMLVMDEAFDEWTIPKSPKGYTLHFNQWYEQDVTDFVRRDRNHPSVILWSCGNEVPEQNAGDKGVEVVKKLLAVFHREDPTRPVTQGCNQIDAANRSGFADLLDVVGYNYMGDRITSGWSEGKGWTCRYDEDHKKYPKRIMIGSENCSSLNTRGVYSIPEPLSQEAKRNRKDFYCPSYDVISEIPLLILKTRPYVCGYFSWEGFDYIGEPTPFPWPAVSSYFGIVDLCGFPKDTYFLHQSLWTDKPMVHVFPHWNWHKGDIVPVWAYTNCESVELFLNGKSLGEHRMDEYDDLAHVFWDVPWEPGELKVVGMKAGKKVVTDKVETTGVPHHLAITVDRPAILAGGEDIAFLTVSVCDENGRIVPTAENLVTFSVKGPGKIIGVGNGNPISHEPCFDQQRHAFMGFCQGVILSTEEIGTITISVNAAMLEGACLSLDSF